MGAEKPLHSLTVVDFTTYVAAPSCSMLLGYLGANVIKVEPSKGDPSRLSGPGIGIPATAEENPLYDTYNSYKRAIALDLRCQAGREILYRLLDKADVLVTNYRQKALEGIGISYEEVSRRNPALVYAHFTAYGDKGPDAAKMGFDSLSFYARSGLADTMQYRGLPPILAAWGSGDLFSGMTLLSGILAGVVAARETGKGTRVSTSLLASGIWMLNCGIVQNQFSEDIRPDQEKLTMAPSTCYYECADGTWVKMGGQPAERYWEPMCHALGLEDYIDDERFNDSTRQLENAEACVELLTRAVAQKKYEEWDPLFRKYDIPAEKVQTAREISGDPQALANHLLCDVEYPGIDRTLHMPMPPIKMASVPDEVRDRGPRLGEHTREILLECGYSEAEVAALLAEGAAKQF